MDVELVDALIPFLVGVLAVVCITILSTLHDPIPAVLTTVASVFLPCSAGIATYHRMKKEDK